MYFSPPGTLSVYPIRNKKALRTILKNNLSCCLVDWLLFGGRSYIRTYNGVPKRKRARRCFVSPTCVRHWGSEIPRRWKWGWMVDTSFKMRYPLKARTSIMNSRERHIWRSSASQISTAVSSSRRRRGRRDSRTGCSAIKNCPPL